MGDCIAVLQPFLTGTIAYCRFTKHVFQCIAVNSDFVKRRGSLAESHSGGSCEQCRSSAGPLGGGTRNPAVLSFSDAVEFCNLRSLNRALTGTD